MSFPLNSDLPDTFALANARLPDAYMAAKLALANCAQLDECQDWANKAEALASYARMSKDDTLQKHAIRIQARAIRRCGILLKEVAPSGGGRPALTHTDPDTSLTRTQAAKDAGLSKRQKDTALCVANVDEAEFEAAVESANPPTVAQIAEAGTKHKPIFDPEGIPSELFNQATQFGGALGRLAGCCQRLDAAVVVDGFQAHEISKISGQVHAIHEWLDIVIRQLEPDSKILESGLSPENQYAEHRREITTLSETAKQKFDRIVKQEQMELHFQFQAAVRREFKRTLPDRLAALKKQEEKVARMKLRYQTALEGIRKIWTEDEYKLVKGVCHTDREAPKERKDKAFILLQKLDSYFSTLKAESGLKI